MENCKRCKDAACEYNPVNRSKKMKTTVEWCREFWKRVGVVESVGGYWSVCGKVVGYVPPIADSLAGERWQSPFEDDRKDPLNMLELTWKVLQAVATSRGEYKIKLITKLDMKTEQWHYKCCGKPWYPDLRVAIVMAICAFIKLSYVERK